MKKFNEAYEKSKKTVNESRQQQIDREHALIVESVKKEFGVTNLGAVSDLEKKELRSIVLEYWDPKSGLTEKGQKYLNEGVSAVNESSSPETIKRHILNQASTYLRQWVDGSMSPAEVEDKLSVLIRDMRLDGVKVKIGSVKDKESIKGILAEQLCKLFCARLASFKLQ
jgi:hypothetical protein